ncbi:Uncharacterized protein FWK35_00034858, partial [Aphis craccivora]
MKRANQEKSSGEIIFIDSSGSCDQSGSCVTFLFGSTKSGGIPLGCIIHQLQTQENYTLGFAQLKSVLGPTAFRGRGEPLVIMTDDSSAERNALKSVFPHSNLLLCIFHVLKAMWRWLWDSKHDIANQDRKHLMKLFRSIAYADNEENLVEMVDTRHINENRSNFKWCIAYRSTLRTREHNTNNIVESSIRVFKDIVLERCKAFNAAALVDFVGNTTEDYHGRRLLKYANVRTLRMRHVIVQLEEEDSFANINALVVLAKLAIGSVDETFFQDMNKLHANDDKSNETEAQDNFDECMVV